MPLDATQPVPPGLPRLLAFAMLLVALCGCSGSRNVSASGTSGIIPDSEVEDFTLTETDSATVRARLFTTGGEPVGEEWAQRFAPAR